MYLGSKWNPLRTVKLIIAVENSQHFEQIYVAMNLKLVFSSCNSLSSDFSNELTLNVRINSHHKAQLITV